MHPISLFSALYAERGIQTRTNSGYSEQRLIKHSFLCLLCKRDVKWGKMCVMGRKWMLHPVFCSFAGRLMSTAEYVHAGPEVSRLWREYFEKMLKWMYAESNCFAYSAEHNRYYIHLSLHCMHGQYRLFPYRNWVQYMLRTTFGSTIVGTCRVLLHIHLFSTLCRVNCMLTGNM